MRPDIVPGAKFPDYELPDHTGTLRRLSELQSGAPENRGDDPLYLTLARGGYCPKDHLQHSWMAAMEPEFESAYCRIVTISTDNILQTREWKYRLGAHWTFLSDEGRLVQQDLDIREYTDPQHNPMVPHTIMLLPGLIVYKIYNGYWYWGRPTPEELRQDFRTIQKQIRPDWDLSAPGLREKWEAGERDIFWPYGKRLS